MHSQNRITIQLPTMQMEVVKRAAHVNGVSPEQFILQQLGLDHFERGINNTIRDASQGHLGSAEMGVCTRCMESRTIGGGTDTCGECVLDFPEACPQEVHDAFQDSWNQNGTHCTTCNEWLPPPPKARPAFQEQPKMNALGEAPNDQPKYKPTAWRYAHFHVDFDEVDAYGAVWAFAREVLDMSDPELSRRLKASLNDRRSRIDAIKGIDLVDVIEKIEQYIETCEHHQYPPDSEAAQGINFYATWGQRAIDTMTDALGTQAVQINAMAYRRM